MTHTRTRRATHPAGQPARECRCRRRTAPHGGGVAVQVPPTLIGTFRGGDLVDIRRVHTCGLPDQILDPTDW